MKPPPPEFAEKSADSKQTTLMVLTPFIHAKRHYNQLTLTFLVAQLTPLENAHPVRIWVRDFVGLI